MERRLFVGGAVSGFSITGARAQPRKVKADASPTTTLGKTGVKVSVIALGGALMNFHSDIQTAAAQVRKMFICQKQAFRATRFFASRI